MVILWYDIDTMKLRMQKINSQIQRYLSDILKDYSEIVSFPMVNFVDTAKDLSQSDIYISFIAEDQIKQFNTLSEHFGQIQEMFAQKATFKKTPHLNFILDKKQNSINKVEEILENLNKQE